MLPRFSSGAFATYGYGGKSPVQKRSYLVKEFVALRGRNLLGMSMKQNPNLKKHTCQKQTLLSTGESIFLGVAFVTPLIENDQRNYSDKMRPPRSVGAKRGFARNWEIRTF